MKIFELKNITHSYGEKEVIKNISLSIDENEFMGFIGPNGSGKTTLLKLISRALMPVSGEILFKGVNTASLKAKYLASNIAMVPQEENPAFPFTVEEIVLMGRAPYINRFSWETKADYETAEKAMKLADVLKLKDRRIDELSSGEKQRVIIARGLAQKPGVILLDEPTSHLDINHQIDIFNLLKSLNQKEKITVIMVLHDINLAVKYCGRLVLIKNGKVYKDGMSDEVATPKNIKEVYGVDVKFVKSPSSGRLLMDF
jgi:iron complex transport system ATP-binding protein